MDFISSFISSRIMQNRIVAMLRGSWYCTVHLLRTCRSGEAQIMNASAKCLRDNETTLILNKTKKDHDKME